MPLPEPLQTPEEERFARLLARLTPAQRAAYLKKRNDAERLQQIVREIESDDGDDPQAAND